MQQNISLNIFIISLYLDRFYTALLADMGIFDDMKKKKKKKKMNERTVVKSFGK